MEIKGPVIKGEQKASRYYGVPTANIDFFETPALALGVYVGSVALADGSTHPCLICYSVRGSASKFEVHLFNWRGDLYGQELRVEVGNKVSDLVPFAGEEAMKNKVLADFAKAKKMLGLI